MLLNWKHFCFSFNSLLCATMNTTNFPSPKSFSLALLPPFFFWCVLWRAFVCLPSYKDAVGSTFDRQLMHFDSFLHAVMPVCVSIVAPYICACVWVSVVDTSAFAVRIRCALNINREMRGTLANLIWSALQSRIALLRSCVSATNQRMEPTHTRTKRKRNIKTQLRNISVICPGTNGEFWTKGIRINVRLGRLMECIVVNVK